MNFHTEVLTERQVRVLDAIASIAHAGGFYLAGGTVLGSDPKHNILRHLGSLWPSWQSARPWRVADVYGFLENAVSWGLTPLVNGG